MESNKNLTIGVLSVTAVILFVGLIVVHSLAGGGQQAFAAAGAGVQSGDYMLVNGQFKVDRELFYLIDASSEQLVVYRYDEKTRQAFGPTQSIDLKELRGGVPQGSPPPKGKGGYQRP